MDSSRACQLVRLCSSICACMCGCWQSEHAATCMWLAHTCASCVHAQTSVLATCQCGLCCCTDMCMAEQARSQPGTQIKSLCPDEGSTAAALHPNVLHRLPGLWADALDHGLDLGSRSQLVELVLALHQDSQLLRPAQAACGAHGPGDSGTTQHGGNCTLAGAAGHCMTMQHAQACMEACRTWVTREARVASQRTGSTS